MCCRYVNDIFNVFCNKGECNEFLTFLNSLHPSLCSTFEKENNCSLPFLDVLVKKSDSRFIASVYRKLIFTHKYVRWNSFCSKKRKINFVSSLVRTAWPSGLNLSFKLNLPRFGQSFGTMVTRTTSSTQF